VQQLKSSKQKPYKKQAKNARINTGLSAVNYRNFVVAT
jgi:hypothetical protein